MVLFKVLVSSISYQMFWDVGNKLDSQTQVHACCESPAACLQCVRSFPSTKVIVHHGSSFYIKR